MEAVKKDLESKATKDEVEAKLSLDKVQNLLKDLEHKTESSVADVKEMTNKALGLLDACDKKIDSLEVSFVKFNSNLTALQQDLANKVALPNLKLQKDNSENSLGDDLIEKLKKLEQQVAKDKEEMIVKNNETFRAITQSSIKHKKWLDFVTKHLKIETELA